MKNISSLKQELLGPYIIPNNYTNNLNMSMKFQFKEAYTFEERKKEYQKIYF